MNNLNKSINFSALAFQIFQRNVNFIELSRNKKKQKEYFSEKFHFSDWKAFASDVKRS